MKALLNQNVHSIGIDISTSAHGAAEGATLATHSFDRLKNPKSRKPVVDFGPFLETIENVDPFLTWETGQIYGASQNLARSLMETPANLMTPKIFAEEIAYLLAGLEKVEVVVRDEEWAARQGMNSLIGVAKGRYVKPSIGSSTDFKATVIIDSIHEQRGTSSLFGDSI